MAITHSPTLRRFTSPILTKGRPAASILTTATSVRLSAPTIRALNSRLSVSVTSTSSAPSTTWALVMMKPSALRMKPEPTPRCCGSSSPRGPDRGPGRPGMGMPKRRKNSSMLGSTSPAPGALARPRSMVRMLTTEGPTRSTSSVKSGKACADTTGGSASAAAPSTAAASCSMRLRRVPAGARAELERRAWNIWFLQWGFKSPPCRWEAEQGGRTVTVDCRTAWVCEEGYVRIMGAAARPPRWP